jgi:hypothetical protein
MIKAGVLADWAAREALPPRVQEVLFQPIVQVQSQAKTQPRRSNPDPLNVYPPQPFTSL